MRDEANNLPCRSDTSGRGMFEIDSMDYLLLEVGEGGKGANSRGTLTSQETDSNASIRMQTTGRASAKVHNV